MRYERKSFVKFFVYTTLIAALVFVFGCSDSTSNAPASSGKGRIIMKMVDAPSAFDEVNIVVSRVEVHKAGNDSTGGWITINSNPATYDLLTLRNGANAVLGDTTLDAGQYTQIRLIIGDGSNIVVDGQTHSLNIPSGMQTGVKLNHEFQINGGDIYNLTLDFNTDHSIVVTGNGQYKLKPVIRLVANIVSGSISGVIDPDSIKTTVSAMSSTDTVTTISDTTNGYFKLMALQEGTYDVRFVPADTTYKDTTIIGVNVTAQQNNDLGTVILKTK